MWQYASVMGFLDPFLEECPSTSNLDEGPVEGEESREDEGETEEYVTHTHEHTLCKYALLTTTGF